MYVWFDALTNYMTAVGFPDDDVSASQSTGRRTFTSSARRSSASTPSTGRLSAWPPGCRCRKRIVGHGWWLMDGAKMSKSIGNVVRPQAYTERFGVDAFRYFVLREMTLGQDANFSDEAFLTRYNADLANDLGNLVSRATTMIHRYCGGVVPEPEAAHADPALAAQVQNLFSLVRTRMGESFQFSMALRDIWDVISATNKYIATTEPWALAKDESKRAQLNAVLYQSADVLRVVGGLIEPVMPATTPRIRKMLGIDAQTWQQLEHERLRPGTRLGTTEPLFPRVEQTVEELRKMADQETPATQATPPAAPSQAPGTANVAPGTTNVAPGTANPEPGTRNPEPDRISIDQFMNVELRTAKVIAAENVPKSKKLIKLQVDLGTEQRTILAGIAEAYQPESLVGRTIVVVANLKPAKLMGIESNGMVLAASPEGGQPVLLTVDAEPGWRVR